MEKQRKETLTDIPEKMLGQVITDYQESGARVETQTQKNGLYTVIAIFGEDDRDIKSRS